MKNHNDYIFDGDKFLGDFELMYSNHPDPWEQSKKTYNTTYYNNVSNIVSIYKCQKVLEIGTGFGNLAHKLKLENPDIEILGIDISETAIKKAKLNSKICSFKVGNIKDFNIIKEFQPDIIILPWIQWYILNELDSFINFLKTKMPHIKILNCFAVYPKNKQKYGADKFNSIEEIMSYYDANFIEWGSFFDAKGNQNSFFLCDYKR